MSEIHFTNGDGGKVKRFPLTMRIFQRRVDELADDVNGLAGPRWAWVLIGGALLSLALGAAFDFTYGALLAGAVFGAGIGYVAVRIREHMVASSIRREVDNEES